MYDYEVQVQDIIILYHRNELHVISFSHNFFIVACTNFKDIFIIQVYQITEDINFLCLVI